MCTVSISMSILVFKKSVNKIQFKTKGNNINIIITVIIITLVQEAGRCKKLKIGKVGPKNVNVSE